MRGPSAKAMIEYFDSYIAHGDVEARQLRALKRTMIEASGRRGVDAVLDEANRILRTHGVEAIRGDYHVDNYYFDIVALYLNTGDTYAPTLLYETDRGRFVLTTMGDWVERNERIYKTF